MNLDASVLLRFVFWETAISLVMFVGISVALRLFRVRSPKVESLAWATLLLRLVLPLDLGLRLPGLVFSEKGPVLLAQALGSDGEISAAVESGALALTQGAAAATPWPELLVGGWLLGSLTLGLLILLRRRHWVRMAKRGAPVRDPHTLAIAEEWRGTLGVRRPIRVVESSNAPTPFTVGSLRPIIVVPRGRNGAEVHAAIAHEVAHIRRWDDLRLLAESALLTFYFFNPVVWFALKRRALNREQLCDDRVLGSGRITHHEYARQLVADVRRQATWRLMPGLPWAGRARSAVELRLRHIVRLQAGTLKRRRFDWGAVLLGGFLLPLSVSPEAGSGPTSPPVIGASQEAPKLVHPLPGRRITSGFGSREDPTSGASVFHDGVDIHGDRGDAVLAAAAGVVVIATREFGNDGSWGTVVVIDHGSGFETRYAHLDELRVAVDARVAAGDVIGTAGVTGRVTGRHLHFELRQDGTAMDPLPALESRAARGGT